LDLDAALRAASMRELVSVDLNNFIQTLGHSERFILRLAAAVEGRDRYLGLRHCSRLAVFSHALGERLGISREEQTALLYGAFLHDIGKVVTPDSVLFKSGKLTEEEWSVMREHTAFGEQLCKSTPALARVLPIIRNHHERWDGSGYPDGLRGEEIPLLARVMQTADLYDALTTSRAYKRGFSADEAFQVLKEEARRGWRDPKLVDLLMDLQVAELDRVAMSFPDLLADVIPNGASTNADMSLWPVEFYSCFVSHSSHDAIIARRINDDLRKNNIKSWYAPEDLKIGERFRLRIDESIKLHDKLLLILSHSSIRSGWVESEVETALEHERGRAKDVPENKGRGRTILFPICIDNAVFEESGGWAAEVRRTRHIGDFRNWQEPDAYDLAFKRLLRDLAANDN